MYDAIELLCSRLKELRTNCNFSQEDIATFLGVGRTTYSAYERGERQMDYQSLVKIAGLYKVSLDYLFGRTDFPVHIESYSSDEIEFMTKALKLYKDIKYKYR